MSHGSAGDYIPLTTLPAACWNLWISSSGHRGNVLALRTEITGQRLLNWDRTIRQPGRYPLATARLGGSAKAVLYERRKTTAEGHVETARADRSLAEPLGVFMLYTEGRTDISWSCHLEDQQQPSPVKQAEPERANVYQARRHFLIFMKVNI